MKYNAKEMIDELVQITQFNIKKAQDLISLPLDQLNQKQNETSWSALECLEHLNRYGDFYIPEIRNKMSSSKHENEAVFKSNFLGNYFSNAMKHKEKLNNMKTFKSMNPLGSELDKTVIDRFLDQQKMKLDLLEKARSKSLTRIKTGITISSLIKLRLGDTFRVVIFHNDRHMRQAWRAIA